eukprot:1151148-Pelagomonas_calceolata.AAC.6
MAEAHEADTAHSSDAPSTHPCARAAPSYLAALLWRQHNVRKAETCTGKRELWLWVSSGTTEGFIPSIWTLRDHESPDSDEHEKLWLTVANGEMWHTNNCAVRAVLLCRESPDSDEQ